MIFNTWFGYFEYVGYLPRGVTLIVISQLTSRFDCYQLQLVHPTVEHHPARNFQHETSQTVFDMFDPSQHLLHTLHKSFTAFQLRFYLSWNNKAYAENVAFFFNLQYKNGYTKFTNFDVFFFKCTRIWQLSQYNLTKLFWMKLKTTKRS